MHNTKVYITANCAPTGTYGGLTCTDCTNARSFDRGTPLLSVNVVSTLYHGVPPRLFPKSVRMRMESLLHVP